MATKILLVRHGKSIAQERDRFAGTTDYPLCEEGKSQIQKLTNRLRDFNIGEIYSSPLIRTRQTVQPIAEILNKEIKIEDKLKEIHVGEWEDISWTELREKYPEIVKSTQETGYYTGIKGQEETEKVANRMFEIITKIAKENDGKTMLLSSHTVAISAFLCKILDIPFEEKKSKIGIIDNTSITFMDYNDISNKFEVSKIGDNSHNK